MAHNLKSVVMVFLPTVKSNPFSVICMRIFTQRKMKKTPNSCGRKRSKEIETELEPHSEMVLHVTKTMGKSMENSPFDLIE